MAQPTYRTEVYNERLHRWVTIAEGKEGECKRQYVMSTAPRKRVIELKPNKQGIMRVNVILDSSVEQVKDLSAPVITTPGYDAHATIAVLEDDGNILRSGRR